MLEATIPNVHHPLFRVIVPENLDSPASSRFHWPAFGRMITVWEAFATFRKSMRERSCIQTLTLLFVELFRSRICLPLIQSRGVTYCVNVIDASEAL